MAALHQLGVLALLAGATFSMADMGPSCGSKCGADACEDKVEIDANVPQIYSATWTVTVCQNSDCASTRFSQYSSPGLAVRIDDSGASPKLVVLMHPHSTTPGDTWSLDVVDQQGKTIVSGKKVAAYSSFRNSPACSSCEQAVVSIN